MKRKNLLVATLIMFALVVTGVTFAYWAGSLTGNHKDDSVIIQVGTGKDVTTSVDLGTVPSAADFVLVPAGRVDVGNPVTGKTLKDEIQLVYTVTWNEDIDTGNSSQVNDEAITGVLTASVVSESVKIDGSTTHADLVDISFSYAGSSQAISLEGSLVVTLTIKLIEPTTEAIYNLVAGKNITFDLSFTVVPK